MSAKSIKYLENKPKLYPVALAAVLCLFFIVNFLAILGLLPELSQASLNFNIMGQPVDMLVIKEELPVSIHIPALGLNSVIYNPVQSDKDSLNQALLQGIVRYPGSGALGRAGNIVLLGHSSHLPYVRNKAYQAFNDINTLQERDEIILKSTNKTNRYKVTSVVLTRDSNAIINLKSSKSKLTLITCNNFGSKEDRYIIEAELIKNT